MDLCADLFDNIGTSLHDRSGNRNDAVMNGNKWSADYPDLNCIWQGAQMAQKQDLAAIGEHGAATLGCPSCQGGDNAHQPPVNIALTIA